MAVDDINTSFIDQGMCSAADILEFSIQKKLALKSGDRDLVVMLHEVEYEQEGNTNSIKSSMVLKGDDDVHTAMAKTVGLPVAIAAKLILLGKINVTGLCIPVLPEIYAPVMKELKEYGISF